MWSVGRSRRSVGGYATVGFKTLCLCLFRHENNNPNKDHKHGHKVYPSICLLTVEGNEIATDLK